MKIDSPEKILELVKQYREATGEYLEELPITTEEYTKIVQGNRLLAQYWPYSGDDAEYIKHILKHESPRLFGVKLTLYEEEGQ